MTIASKKAASLVRRALQDAEAPTLLSVCWPPDGNVPSFRDHAARSSAVVRLGGGYDCGEGGKCAREISELSAAIVAVNSGKWPYFAATDVGGLFGRVIFGLMANTYAEFSDTGDYRTVYVTKEEALAELNSQIAGLRPKKDARLKGWPSQRW